MNSASQRKLRAIRLIKLKPTGRADCRGAPIPANTAGRSIALRLRQAHEEQHRFGAFVDIREEGESGDRHTVSCAKRAVGLCARYPAAAGPASHQPATDVKGIRLEAADNDNAFSKSLSFSGIQTRTARRR